MGQRACTFALFIRAVFLSIRSFVSYFYGRHSVSEDVVVFQLGADVHDGFDCFVPHDGFFHRAQAFQWHKQAFGVFFTTYVGHELSQLFGHGQQYFIFVVHVVREEREEFVSGSFFSECKRDGGEPTNGFEPQSHVFVLQFVDEHCDRIQRVVFIVRHGVLDDVLIVRVSQHPPSFRFFSFMWGVVEAKGDAHGMDARNHRIILNRRYPPNLNQAEKTTER